MHGAPEITPDPAKTIDTYADGHSFDPLFVSAREPGADSTLSNLGCGKHRP